MNRPPGCLVSSQSGVCPVRGRTYGSPFHRPVSLYLRLTVDFPRDVNQILVYCKLVWPFISSFKMTWESVYKIPFFDTRTFCPYTSPSSTKKKWNWKLKYLIYMGLQNHLTTSKFFTYNRCYLIEDVVGVWSHWIGLFTIKGEYGYTRSSPTSSHDPMYTSEFLGPKKVEHRSKREPGTSGGDLQLKSVVGFLLSFTHIPSRFRQKYPKRTFTVNSEGRCKVNRRNPVWISVPQTFDTRSSHRSPFRLPNHLLIS